MDSLITRSAAPSSGVSERVSMINFAPACLAMSGYDAAGCTTRVEPAAISKSQFLERCSARKGFLLQALAKGDGVGFEQSIALVTAWTAMGEIKGVHYHICWLDILAVKTDNFKAGTVEVDHHFRGESTFLVQPVNILSDQAPKFSLCIELSEEGVGRSGQSFLE
jgi:hypothetical protein